MIFSCVFYLYGVLCSADYQAVVGRVDVRREFAGEIFVFRQEV